MYNEHLCRLARLHLGEAIPHICHFLYTGRIFKFKILHLEITQIYPKKVKYVVFLRSIWKNLHPTEFFTRAAPVVPVTNMRYARNKPENQDKDAQGKIEQQQALSFGKCSQHEWEPQMMSKEKGTSIKVGTQKG